MSSNAAVDKIRGARSPAGAPFYRYRAGLGASLPLISSDFEDFEAAKYDADKRGRNIIVYQRNGEIPAALQNLWFRPNERQLRRPENRICVDRLILQIAPRRAVRHYNSVIGVDYRRPRRGIGRHISVSNDKIGVVVDRNINRDVCAWNEKTDWENRLVEKRV
ncbi:MAG: hypothetical protein WC329_04405 [Candidatus Omnitrophota bacterium]